MAGNIIPAIATTNAIIAGLIVMQSLNILSRIHSTSNGGPSTDSSSIPVRNVFLRTDPTKPLGSFLPQHPDPTCSVCRDVYIPFKADVGKCTLGEFVEDAVKDWLGSAEFEGQGEGEDVEWTVFEGGRLLADPDFDDNLGRTLDDLGVGRGKILTVRDEDTKYRPVHFCVCQPWVSNIYYRVCQKGLIINTIIIGTPKPQKPIPSLTKNPQSRSLPPNLELPLVNLPKNPRLSNTSPPTPRPRICLV